MVVKQEKVDASSISLGEEYVYGGPRGHEGKRDDIQLGDLCQREVPRLA